MRKILLGMIVCFLGINLLGCGSSVANDPEAVADYAVKCIGEGNLDKLKAISTKQFSSDINVEDLEKMANAKFEGRGMEDFIKGTKAIGYDAKVVTEDSKEREYRLGIIVESVEGKWLLAGCTFKRTR